MAKTKGYEAPSRNFEQSKYYTRYSVPIDEPTSQQCCLFEYFCGGGGIFFCILLLAMVMLLLIVQLIIWRFFDIDVFPVDDTILHKESSNYTFEKCPWK